MLVAVETVFYLAVAILQFTLASDRAPGLLSQLLGGAVFTIVFVGGLSVVAGAGYLLILWQLVGAQARFRIWAVTLSPIIAVPALLDVRALVANPGHIAYWLLPALFCGLLVRPPPAPAGGDIR